MSKRRGRRSGYAHSNFRRTHAHIADEGSGSVDDGRRTALHAQDARRRDGDASSTTLLPSSPSPSSARTRTLPVLLHEKKGKKGTRRAQSSPPPLNARERGGRDGDLKPETRKRKLRWIFLHLSFTLLGSPRLNAPCTAAARGRTQAREAPSACAKLLLLCCDARRGCGQGMRDRIEHAFVCPLNSWHGASGERRRKKKKERKSERRARKEREEGT